MQEHDKILKQVSRRLAQESQSAAAATWLLDNYGMLQSQSRELRESLSPKFWRKLANAEKLSPEPNKPLAFTGSLKKLSTKNAVRSPFPT
jgi:hypothetical protein